MYFTMLSIHMTWLLLHTQKIFSISDTTLTLMLFCGLSLTDQWLIRGLFSQTINAQSGQVNPQQQEARKAAGVAAGLVKSENTRTGLMINMWRVTACISLADSAGRCFHSACHWVIYEWNDCVLMFGNSDKDGWFFFFYTFSNIQNKSTAKNEAIFHWEMVSNPHLCCEIFRVSGIFSLEDGQKLGRKVAAVGGQQLCPRCWPIWLFFVWIGNRKWWTLPQ